MIGDLSNAPEPIQIKLFIPNPAVLEEVATRVSDTIKKQSGVVDVLDGLENTISGPAVSFQVDPSIAQRLGFTVQEITTDTTAIVEGVPATMPLIATGPRYPIRGRYPEANRSSISAMEDTGVKSANGSLATWRSISATTLLS